MTPLIAQTQPPTLNLVFFGDSLTEGVPHFDGETDTMPFMVNQQFPGATYIKLGYRGQTSGYLREKFDGWLCAQYKADMENVLVLWTGTNDLALNTTNVVPQVYANMVALAQAAHSAGWKVVVVMVISRSNYFVSTQAQAEFPSEQATLNQMIHSSTAFDAVADPAPQLTDTSDTTLFWDGCHLFPKGYQIVADLVVQAIRSIPQ